MQEAPCSFEQPQELGVGGDFLLSCCNGSEANRSLSGGVILCVVVTSLPVSQNFCIGHDLGGVRNLETEKQKLKIKNSRK